MKKAFLILVAVFLTPLPSSPSTLLPETSPSKHTLFVFGGLPCGKDVCPCGCNPCICVSKPTPKPMPAPPVVSRPLIATPVYYYPQHQIHYQPQPHYFQGVGGIPCVGSG